MWRSVRGLIRASPTPAELMPPANRPVRAHNYRVNGAIPIGGMFGAESRAPVDPRTARWVIFLRAGFAVFLGLNREFYRILATRSRSYWEGVLEPLARLMILIDLPASPDS